MRNNTSTNAWLTEIANTHPLKRDNERRLFEEYQVSSETRKKKIREIIIQSNLRFVLDVALVYKYTKGVNIQELFSEGKIGLLIAFDKFDKNSKLKFISYAVWWIRSRITKYLEQNDLIRIPTHHKTKLMKDRKTKDPVDFDEDTYYLHEITSTHVSLDSRKTNNQDVNTLSISETVQDEKAENIEDVHSTKKLKEDLITFLSKVLKEEEFIVISNLYGIGTNNPLPLRDVKDLIGKSHERVRQIRDNALRTLRKNFYNIESFKELYHINNE